MDTTTTDYWSDISIKEQLLSYNDCTAFYIVAFELNRHILKK